MSLSFRFTSSQWSGGRFRLPLCLAFLALPVSAQSHDHEHQAAAASRYERLVQAYPYPDATLTSVTGHPVQLSSLLDRDGPVLLQFIFTTCTTVCPVMSAGFASLQERLGPELQRVRMVSISIDPEYDTPARLAEYANRYKAGSQWTLLTGSEADIAALQRAFDAYPGSKMLHRPLTFLRGSPSQPWTRLDGLTSGAELLSEYRRVARP